MSSLGLNNSVTDWKESVINILIVGKDGKSIFPYPNIVDENGRTVERLASRADATILLSFNKVTQKTTLFSLVRDNYSNQYNEILTHIYILNGRSAYIEEVKKRVKAMALQNSQFRDVFAADNQVHIHGMIEIDFQEFMDIVDKIKSPNYFVDGLKFIWSIKSRAKDLFALLDNRHALLKLLRARQNHPAGSYQRSLNHALFLNSVMALAGYSVTESGEKSFYQNSLVQDIFKGLSRTFDLEQLRESLNLKNLHKSMLETVCIKNAISNSRLVLLGISDHAYAILDQGRLSYLNDQKYATDSLLQNLEFNLIELMKVESASTCK